MKAIQRARALSRALIPLETRTLEPAELEHVRGGGQVGSHSWSGSPRAQDDTEGDTPDGGGGDILVFDIIG